MDKLNKYLHKLVSQSKGEIIYSQRSTYYHIRGRVIRVSDHIGRNSDGSISIIYDASGSDRYIVHAHGSGMISIVNYENVKNLSNESRQKLCKYQPINLGQASRISGIAPVDISLILVALQKKGK